MSHDQPGYGLWMLVILNSAIFLMFAFSFFKPQTGRDWRTFGAFAAFVIALFVEMYGFPLTIYLMSGWLQTKYPSLDLMSHNSGHLWSTLLGEKGAARVGGLAVNEIQHWAFDAPHEMDAQIQGASYQTSSVYGFGHPLYYDNVIKTLRGEAEAETDGREGLKSLELLIALYMSARDGKRVSLPLSY